MLQNYNDLGLKEIYRNARKKCEYFNSANCARCFPLTILIWCALIRLSHLRLCLALAVVAQKLKSILLKSHNIILALFFLALRTILHNYCFAVMYILVPLFSTNKYSVTFYPFNILAHSGSVLVLALVLFDMSCTHFCTNLIKKKNKKKPNYIP